MGISLVISITRLLQCCEPNKLWRYEIPFGLEVSSLYIYFIRDFFFPEKVEFLLQK